MAAKWGLVFAAVVVSLSPTLGQEKQEPIQKEKTGYVKVEIKGMLITDGGEKKTWAIKVKTELGGEFSWPVVFVDAQGKASEELEKTARRFENTAVVVSGELMHLPASTIEWPATPGSASALLGPQKFASPPITCVLARTLREAEKK